MLLAYIILLVLLFLLLGKSAEILVRAIKTITADLGIPIIFSGLILGFFTSAPEFFIGITSSLRDANAISFGNLMGGILVLFGLVTPLNILMQRGVLLQHAFKPMDFFSIIIYLILPLLLAMDGVLGFWEGLINFSLYILLAFLLTRRELGGSHRVSLTHNQSHRKIYFQAVSGLAGILIFSKFIVDISLLVIDELALGLFAVGLFVFSFGTNLPEIIIAVESWKNRAKSLGIGNVIGSAITNVFIVGIVALLRPVVFTPDVSYFMLFIFFIVIAFLFMAFSISSKRLTQKEGGVLLAAFVLFLFFNAITLWSRN